MREAYTKHFLNAQVSLPFGSCLARFSIDRGIFPLLERLSPNILPGTCLHSAKNKLDHPTRE